MKATNIIGAAALALAASATGSAALAQGDIYSRLMEARTMDRNKDGMVSKDEFLATLAKTWDAHVAEKKNPRRQDDRRELQGNLRRIPRPQPRRGRLSAPRAGLRPARPPRGLTDSGSGLTTAAAGCRDASAGIPLR